MSNRQNRSELRGLALLAGCGFLVILVCGGFAGPLPAAEPALTVGTVNLSLVCFFHPRMREYDPYGSRFLKYDEAIAALPPAERMKARRERALKRVEEMKTGEFKEELKRLQNLLAKKENELQEAQTRMENLTSDFRTRLEYETRGLSTDDPVCREITEREKKNFKKRQAELYQTLEDLLLEKEAFEEGIREKKFMAATPAAYTNFMETDRIYWAIRADIRKTLQALCEERGIAVLLNSSYLLQDFIPFEPWEEREISFPDGASWRAVCEELCRDRNLLAGDFPLAVETLVLPADDRLAVVDLTAEAADRLLTIYGASPTEKQVVREIIEARLKSAGK